MFYKIATNGWDLHGLEVLSKNKSVKFVDWNFNLFARIHSANFDLRNVIWSIFVNELRNLW